MIFTEDNSLPALNPFKSNCTNKNMTTTGFIYLNADFQSLTWLFSYCRLFPLKSSD